MSEWSGEYLINDGYDAHGLIYFLVCEPTYAPKLNP